MPTLRTLVAGHPDMAEELPLIHTSRCEHLSVITTAHTLEPRPCSVFSESLIYLFYGRPAYRSTRGTKGGESIALCPVCFVFKPRTVSLATHRLYPCDSGAVAGDFFKPEITTGDLAQLAFDPQIENARRWVSLMFNGNTNYFRGKVVAGKTFVAGSLEERFCKLLMRPGPVDYDDRKSAIEVQVNQIITLKDQLLFVVLPNEFLEEKQIRNAIINIWNCDPVGYPTVNGDVPASYNSVVRDRVTSRFEEATRI